MKKIIAAGLMTGVALIGASPAGMGIASATPTCPANSEWDVQLQSCAQTDGYHGTVMDGPEIDPWSMKKGEGMAQLALELRRRGPSSSDVRDLTPTDACDTAITTVVTEGRDPEIARYSDRFDWLSARVGCMSELRRTGHIS